MENEILEIIINHNINGFELPGGTDKAEGHSYDIFYNEYFNEYKDKEGSLLEIGVQYGGSSLLWHDYLPKFNLVLTDIQNQVHQTIWDKMDSKRYEYINMDAFIIENVNYLKERYPEGFDIIVEDGPHTLESQIFTIKEYSKLLKKGGILVIEDIQSEDYIKPLLGIENVDYTELKHVDLRYVKNRYDDLLIVLKK